MMPTIAPAARLSVRTSAARIRFTGQVYLINVATPSSAATTPSVTHAVMLFSPTAHTTIATNTSSVPGNSGTTMPTIPTAIASATRTMPAALMFSTYLGWPLLGIIPTGPCRHGEVRLYPEGHFDIYVGEPFERVVADQIAFLQRHVPVIT